MKLIYVPKMSDVENEFEVTQWFKEINDEVNIGDELVELAGNKMTFVVESNAKGTLTRILVEKDYVKEGDLLCVIASANEVSWEELENIVDEGVNSKFYSIRESIYNRLEDSNLQGLEEHLNNKVTSDQELNHLRTETRKLKRELSKLKKNLSTFLQMPLEEMSSYKIGLELEKFFNKYEKNNNLYKSRKSIVDSWLKLLAKARTKEVVESILEFTEKNELETLFLEVTTISSRWHGIQKKFDRGLVSSEDFNVEVQRINATLIKTIKEFRNSLLFRL